CSASWIRMASRCSTPGTQAGAHRRSAAQGARVIAGLLAAHPVSCCRSRGRSWGGRVPPPLSPITPFETVLSLLTLVMHCKKVMPWGWAYLHARLACTMAAFNVLGQWHGFQPTVSGFVSLSIAGFSL